MAEDAVELLHTNATLIPPEELETPRTPSPPPSISACDQRRRCGATNRRGAACAGSEGPHRRQVQLFPQIKLSFSIKGGRGIGFILMLS